MKILVTGATGLIGRELGRALVQAGHQVVILSRNKNKARQHISYACEVIEADLNQGPCLDPLMNSIEAVIHLAGENVGEGRWTEQRKKRIYASRVGLTKNLFASLSKNDSLKVFVSASAIGIYGDRRDELLTEEAPRGSGFLADVCAAWENSVLSQKSQFSQTRFVILRTGVVLSSIESSPGGALAKMVQPFRWGVGGVLGKGKQWVSWIHLNDLVGIYIKALETPGLEGIINAVSPEPVTNQELTGALAKTLGKKAGPAVPQFILRTLLGEMSSLVLDSTRVQPKRLEEMGYSYEFPQIALALKNCLIPN